MSAVSFQETLTLSRRFEAPIETVFDAWSKAEILASWFGPVGYRVESAKVDCRVGGQYEIIIVSPDSRQIKHSGEYVLVDKPNKLIFTWVLGDQACRGSEGQCVNTLVEINFKSLDSATEITLKHEKLPSQESCDGHQFGWLSSFDSLSNLFLD